MAQDQAAGATKRQSPVRRMVATLVDNKILDRFDGELEEHIATTYSALRRGMAVLAWFLPVVLWSFGTVFGIGLLDSMSAYYYEPEGRDALDTSAALWFYVVGLLPSFVIYLAYRAITHRSITKSTFLIMFAISVGYVITMLFLSATGTFEVLYNYTPMRTIFVGFLCITGSFLYLYKGFTKLENLLLNVAGISAVLVALFPTTDPRCATTLEASAQRGQTITCADFGFSMLGLDLSWHGVFAGVFFLGAAFSIFLCSHKTLRDPIRKKNWYEALFQAFDDGNWYVIFYWIMGLVMLASPLVAWIFTVVSGTAGHKVFVTEAVGMIAFAAYWWVKSDEIKQSRADRTTDSAHAGRQAARDATDTNPGGAVPA